jgi:hypothetical protein
MKYTFIINQAGIIRLGLLGSVELVAWCVLDYLGGWFFSKNAKRAVVDGKEFVWLDYGHAVEELPLLFNPQAGFASRKNQFSRVVQSLRAAGLVESVKVGRNLYLRPSDLAVAIANSRERTVTKSAPSVSPLRDATVTQPHEGSITSNHDDSSPTYITETTISETTINETQTTGGECVPDAKVLFSITREEIYGAYPRQVAKAAALVAIGKAMKKHAPEFLLERTRLFATTYNGEPRFIPYPVKWFNDQRFNDDPATWRIAPPATGKHQPKIISPDSFTNQIGKL